MESNKDEALRCLHISQKQRAAGNLASARKFAQKSLALFSTPEAVKLLELIDSEASSSASSAGSSSSSPFDSAPSEPSSFTSATETHQSTSGTKHRHAPSTAKASSQTSGTQEKREYTAENLAVVKRVRACKVTEYYEIMAVKKDCDEADVKKAYRKVGFNLSIMRICVLNVYMTSSWRSRYTQTRMGRRVLMRPSRVCSLFEICPLSAVFI